MTAPTITALPTAPSRSSDPTTFSVEADAFLGALGDFGTEQNALGTWMDSTAATVVASAATATTQASTATTQAAAASVSAASAANAPGTSADSTTSLLIGTGPKSLTITTDKAFAVGQFVTIASKAGATNYMAGQITAFTSATGALTVSASVIGGSGTFADWTIALSGPASSPDLAQTLTNKTINFASNTVTTTLAQLNTAVSDADVASLAGTETLTNKTVSLASNTLTGTKAQFNTALSDADFVTLDGTETLTNKTINFANNTVTMTLAELNAAISDGDAGGSSWTQIATSTPTAVNSVTFSSIPATYQDMLIVFNGISHDNGTATSFGVAVSVDGTNFSASTIIAGGGAGTIANTSTMRGALTIPGYLKGHGIILGGIANISSASDNVEAAVSGGNAGISWRATTGISAVRLAWGAGNYDAGTITIYGK